MTSLLVHSHSELLAARVPGQRIAVVMTMGALHEGHAQLMREARSVVGSQGVVIVTDFVNPLQFGAGEDFDRYPRTLEADVAICTREGVDIVFAPDVADIYGADYPAGPQITMNAGAIGDVLEGASRPGHFDGMLTVVAKLLHLTAADIALFGEKDYQQLVLISQMVEQLKFPVKVQPVATVREADGLAMSSRNRYLSDAQRAVAATIPRVLAAVVAACDTDGVAAGLAAGSAILATEPAIDVDYLVVTDPMLGSVIEGEGRVLIAARIGQTRLIDNMACIVKGA